MGSTHIASFEFQLADHLSRCADHPGLESVRFSGAGDPQQCEETQREKIRHRQTKNAHHHTEDSRGALNPIEKLQWSDRRGQTSHPSRPPMILHNHAEQNFAYGATPNFEIQILSLAVPSYCMTPGA